MWKKEYSLEDFVKPTEFKSYEDLERRLNQVLKVQPRRVDEEVVDEDDERTPVAVAPRASVTAQSVSTDEDEDDALSYFQKLAET